MGERDTAAVGEELAALRKAFETEGHEVFDVHRVLAEGSSRDTSPSGAADRIHDVALSCDLVVCVDWVERSATCQFALGGALAGAGRPTVLALPRGVRISEQERSLFERNPANLRDKVPGVIWFDQYSDLPRALRNTTLDMDLKIAL